MVASTSKRKASALDVPAKDADPAERKRVLNVLAQRRYRQRKREQLQELEKRVEGTEDLHRHALRRQLQTGTVSSQNTDEIESDVDGTTGLQSPDAPDLQDNFGLQDFSTDPCLDTNFLEPWDPAPFFPVAALPTPPALSSLSPDSGDRYFTSPTSTSTTTPVSSLGFDELNLPLLQLDLMKAAFSIARRLGSEKLIFELNSNSIFHNSPTYMDWSHLPGCLRPTRVQIEHAHHPIFDVLPWPTVRDRLISAFALPEDMRPPVAATSTALIDFAYDMEDTAEGIRVWGEDPFLAENWELGENVFRRWWWALDSSVVRRSNVLRKQRGAPPLTVGPPRVEEIP